MVCPHPTQTHYLPGMGYLLVAHDGAVIFSDYHRIRRIAPGADGVVTGGRDEYLKTIGGYFDFVHSSTTTTAIRSPRSRCSRRSASSPKTRKAVSLIVDTQQLPRAKVRVREEREARLR